MRSLDSNKVYADYGEGLEPVILRTIDGIQTVVRCKDEVAKWDQFFEQNRKDLREDEEYRADAQQMHDFYMRGRQ